MRRMLGNGIERRRGSYACAKEARVHRYWRVQRAWFEIHGLLGHRGLSTTPRVSEVRDVRYAERSRT